MKVGKKQVLTTVKLYHISKTFNAHVNVVVCIPNNVVPAMKYIHKYVKKESDQEIFDVQQENTNINLLDEVQTFRVCCM